MTQDADGGATDRLVDAAAHADPRDAEALDDFVRVYRDWIVAHHDLPGSREERIERTRLLLSAAASATTLEGAIALLARFRRLVWGDRGLETVRQANVLLLRLDQPARPGLGGLVSDLWSLAFLLAMLELLAGGRLEGVAGAVRGAALLPPHAAMLLFDRPLDYGAALPTLRVPADALARPVVVRAAQVEAFMRALVPRTVGRAAREVSMLVAAMIGADALRGVFAGVAEVAARLGMSPATLRRRLAAEGTGFRALREERLDALATAWLAAGERVETIAGRLGYSDGFAFRRAFHRRHGCAPAEWRRRAAT